MSASGPWIFWRTQSSSRSPAGRTLVGSSHSNCNEETVIASNCVYAKRVQSWEVDFFFFFLDDYQPEIRDHQWVLKLWVSARVEAVHPAEALAWRSSTEHLHVAFLWQLLAQGVGLLSGHYQLQQDIAVLGEDRGTGVVEPEGLCCGFPHLDGPVGLRNTYENVCELTSPPVDDLLTCKEQHRRRHYRPGGSLQRVHRSRRTRPASDIWTFWEAVVQSEIPVAPVQTWPCLCPFLNEKGKEAIKNVIAVIQVIAWQSASLENINNFAGKHYFCQVFTFPFALSFAFVHSGASMVWRVFKGFCFCIIGLRRNLRKCLFIKKKIKKKLSHVLQTL